MFRKNNNQIKCKLLQLFSSQDSFFKCPDKIHPIHLRCVGKESRLNT